MLSGYFTCNNHGSRPLKLRYMSHVSWLPYLAQREDIQRMPSRELGQNAALRIARATAIKPNSNAGLTSSAASKQLLEQ